MIHILSSIVAIIGFCCLCTFYAKSNAVPIIGDHAPAFSLTDQHGTVYSLDQFSGKKIALIFYPKDNSTGCTQQICSIRDNITELSDHTIVALGISSGSIIDKEKFAKAYNVPFPLLNATQDVLKLYGVNGTIFRLYLPKRYTFLIDEKGIIVGIIKNITLNNHAQQIIDEFKKASNE